MTDSGDGTIRITTTVPESTRDWLHKTYPDATSDSEALKHAISDSRKFHRYLDIEVDQDADDLDVEE
jgi:hypothetical protein